MAVMAWTAIVSAARRAVICSGAAGASTRSPKRAPQRSGSGATLTSSSSRPLQMRSDAGQRESCVTAGVMDVYYFLIKENMLMYYF